MLIIIIPVQGLPPARPASTLSTCCIHMPLVALFVLFKCYCCWLLFVVHAISYFYYSCSFLQGLVGQAVLDAQVLNSYQ